MCRQKKRKYKNNQIWNIEKILNKMKHTVLTNLLNSCDKYVNQKQTYEKMKRVK